MEFKNLAIDPLSLMAELVRRGAADRDTKLAAALRTIDIVKDGRHGEGRADVHVTVALAKGLEVTIVDRWDQDRTVFTGIVEDAAHIVDVAERIFDDCAFAIEMLREVGSALSREVAKARRRGLPYRTLFLGLTSVEVGTGDLPAATISLEIIGPTLDLRPIWFEAESAEDVVLRFAEMREKQNILLELRSRMAELDADVVIDAPTLAVLEDADVDLPSVIERLRRERHGTVDVDVRHGRLVLYARNGIVTGNAPLGGGMRWQDGKLIVPKPCGISVSRARGRPLNTLVLTQYFENELCADSATDFEDSVWIYAHPAPVAIKLNQLKRAA